MTRGFNFAAFYYVVCVVPEKGDTWKQPRGIEVVVVVHSLQQFPRENLTDLELNQTDFKLFSL